MPTQPQTVTIAQALASSASGLLVLDSAANIAAAASNTGLIARVASFTVSGPALLTAAQMTLLFPIAAKLHAAAGALQLTGNNTFGVARLTSYESLPGFALASGSSLDLTDTTAKIAAMLAATPAWFSQVTAVTVLLDGTSIGAYPASQLNGLTQHGKTVVFVASAGHTALNIAAASHDLATNAAALNTLGTHVPLTFTVTNEGASISAADAASLITLAGFSPSAHTIVVADTGANITAHATAIFGHGFSQIQVTSGTIAGTATQLLDASLHLGSGATAQLASSATLGAAAAATLAGLSGYSHAPGATLTVADTAANLTANTSAWLAAAGAVSLTANATVSASVVTGLGAIATSLGQGFSLGGHTITASDTLAALIAIPAPATALASALLLAADATVSAAQYTTFHGLAHAGLGGHSITIADTAANLLALSAGSLGMASALVLSADASLSAEQAQTLFGDPSFSTGGHQLTVVDTAANLLALPHANQVAATLLTLSANQSLNVATLSQLASLGIKFSAAGHTITCQDTAANLVTLSPVALALINGGEVLSASASVTAATALSLAALPNLSLGAGVTLSVQDTAANLIALGQGYPSIVGSESLLPGSVTITAPQAAALHALPHFSASGATITIADTVAQLSAVGLPVLQGLGSIAIVDTAANLAASASTALVQGASSVSLAGNAQVTAAVAAQIGTIPNFTPGAFQMTVQDTAGAIAQHSAAIVLLASQAIVTDSGPVGIAAADQLAAVAAAGLLSFQGGDQLLVQGSFAALTSGLNTSGFALAARIGVVDTAANLAIAAAHDWGGLNPSYTLSQGGTVSAALATTLAGLGSHFSAGGHTISVADTASATIGAAAALGALGITAYVTDTAANLGSHENALLSLGSSVAAVAVSDTVAVSAATAAALSGLSSLLTGPTLHVADTAADVETSLAGLTALGPRVAVLVSDSAANIGQYAAGFAALGANLSVVLTDNAPVTASVAAALAPVSSQLAIGTQVSITDTSADIAARAATLATMSSSLGTITLSDGTTLTAANAAALAPFDNHLAPGVMLTATGSAAALATNLVGLNTLLTDNRLSGVTVAATTVADVAAHIAMLNSLPSTIGVSDTAAAVDAGLASLAQLTGLQTITLTNGGTPALSMSVATLGADAATLAKITSPFSITITDTASHIAADLALGNTSLINAHSAAIGQISASDGLPVTLTQAQLLAPGVDDGAGSAMSKFAGSLAVTGVDISHLTQVTGLGHAPASIAVSDSSAHIASDLALGNASALLGALPSLVGITSVDGAPIVLTATQAMVAGVDDSASSAIGLLHGAHFAVNEAAIADLPAIATLYAAPQTISVADSAAAISADLASGNSALITNRPTIDSIIVSDGQAISLTEAELVATGVDDGAGSALSKVSNGALTVTQVAASDIAEMLSLGVPASSLSLTDTSVHIVSNLSGILSDIGSITGITVTGAPLTLTAGEALETHVDDGPGSLIDLVSGHVFDVSGAAVSQLSAILGLPDAATSISVSDSSAHIVADLMSGSPALVGAAGALGTVSVTHGTLTLTDAQADTILSSPSVDAVLGHLAAATVVSITGVPVSDIASVAASTWPHLTMAVLDTAASLAADLSLGNSSMLTSNASVIGSVALSAGGTVDAAILADMAALPQFTTNGCPLTVQDNAASVLSLAPNALAFASTVSVLDSDAAVGAALDALQTRFNGGLGITLTGGAPALSVTAGQYSADQATIDAITNPGVVTVTGSAADLAPLAGVLANDATVANVTVSDTAADVIANLGALQSAGAKLHVTLSDSSITANLVAPLLGVANLSLGLPVTDTGTQIAAVAESGNVAAVAYLNTYGASLSDSLPVTAADAAALEGLQMFSKAAHSLVVWDTAQHLTSPSYAAALGDARIDSVHLKAPSGTVTVSASSAVTLFGITGFATTNPDGSSNTLVVSDTAAHIDANLAALTTNLSSISSIIVGSSTTITDQTLADLQGLNAITAAGVGLTVHDTAATIAANAASQASGHSLLPVAWTLSANATVSEATAVVLAGLAHFTAGPYTLTLNLGADTPISISDANALGAIASALNLNGHHLVVTGSAAQLSALTAGALSIVTPALVDSIANIEALPISSPLLTGTVEVTGSDTLSGASASTLLNLIHSGNGPGISSGSLTFDNPHAISDSVANIRSLTSSAAWTANAAVHASFHLVGQDSVANLTNPANTAFLSNLYATTLPGNVSIGAATASSLAGVTNTIHFDRGTFTITVQDSASSLLNPANASGLGLADVVQLAGPDHVDSADAESLLAISHFNLNTALTVTDSSSNLLDGVLSAAITGSGFASHIAVQLAGPETLDAQTAESLIQIPGFSDSHNLTIADDPSYLLDGANLSAEQLATAVTLAGDETVSAQTVLRLSEIPHFTPGDSTLILASNDFADAPTLKAVADIGASFDHNNHSLTVTADVLDLTPTEYTSLQSDGLVRNGHGLGVLPSGITVADSGNTLNVTGTGVGGGTVKVYTDTGALISSTTHVNAAFTATAADTGSGHNFSLTETTNGIATEGAPVVVLDTGLVESAVAAAGGNFASSGAIQVDTGKFVNIYLAGSVPGNLTHAALVYDPSAHTIGLDVPGQPAITLITLGGSTHPASLDPAEILFKTHG